MKASQNPNFQKARQLMESLHFDAALPLLLSLYQDENYSEDMELGFQLVHCLKKLGKHQKGIEIGLNLAQSPEVWPLINQNTAWCIYFEHFKNSHALSQEAALNWLQTIDKICPHAPGLHPIVFSLFSYLAQHKELDSQFVLSLCELIKPEYLDVNPDKGLKSDRYFPSDYEKYMSFKAKALFDQGEYQNCFELCQELLDRNMELVNKVWILRRQALSAANMKKHELALQLYDQVLQEKQDWFIKYEMAQSYFALFEYSKAQSYCLQAANDRGPNQLKIKVWELLAKIFFTTQQYENAVLMLKLCASIRQNQGWKIPIELKRDLDSYNIRLEGLPNENELLSEFWQKNPGFKTGKIKQAGRGPQNNDNKLYNGTILSLLGHNMAGFIASEGNNYYFNCKDCLLPANQIVPGTKVVFQLKKSFDHKKQRESVKAVKIRGAD